MAGIAGIARASAQTDVASMLDRMTHRGPQRGILPAENATLGIQSPAWQDSAHPAPAGTVRDYAGPGHCAQAQVVGDRLILMRDRLGVAPLYYGKTPDGTLCFASEVKALIGVAHDIAELPPGTSYDGEVITSYFRLRAMPAVTESPEAIAVQLLQRLSTAVEYAVGQAPVGAWLSGGLDSSSLVALARPHVPVLHTFAAGLPGAPDLEYAREVAAFVKTNHHEVILTPGQVLDLLPRVIHSLESFDALLVRSSVTNYAAAAAASNHVPTVLSGEGGDELFAGYAYLKAIAPARLDHELLDITGRLHNTALQRVDRSAAAHGIVAHVCFLDPSVVEYAFQIPAMLKLHGTTEKWILRRALEGRLPPRVLERPKAKFWQGAGINELLSDHAEKTISDADFSRERALPNGWQLGTKEELMYYRIFKEHFGGMDRLDWMGRTKGAPIAQ